MFLHGMIVDLQLIHHLQYYSRTAPTLESKLSRFTLRCRRCICPGPSSSCQLSCPVLRPASFRPLCDYRYSRHQQMACYSSTKGRSLFGSSSKDYNCLTANLLLLPPPTSPVAVLPVIPALIPRDVPCRLAGRFTLACPSKPKLPCGSSLEPLVVAPDTPRRA